MLTIPFGVATPAGYCSIIGWRDYDMLSLFIYEIELLIPEEL